MRVATHFLLWGLGLASAQTQTSEKERNCLVRYAQGRRRLAEIGVWHGVTTSLLRQAMATDGILLAIDPFPPGQLGFSIQRVIAHKEVGRSAVGQVKWLRMKGVQAASDPSVKALGGIDFMFIDGDHSYEALQADWNSWSPLIAAGGIVALHDSCDSGNGLISDAGSVRFTRDVVVKDHTFEVLERVETTTVLRRLANVPPAGSG